MSVLILDLTEVNSIRNHFIESTNLYNELKVNSLYQKLAKHYITEYEKNQSEYQIYVKMIDRLLWYMHISNIIAYNLNYNENIEIEHDFIFDDNAESYEPIKSDDSYYHRFGSLMYNISTNAGTVFLPAKFEDLAEFIYNLVKKETFFKNDTLLLSDIDNMRLPKNETDKAKNTKWFVKS